MVRNYVHFSLLAFLAYSMVAPLLKVAMMTIPSTPAVFLSNSVLLVAVGILVVYRGQSPTRYLRHPYAPHTFAMGVLLTVGLLTYYRALALAPVSTVVPIYGLFIVVSSTIGIFVFNEAVTARKIAGLILSVLAIGLVSI